MTSRDPISVLEVDIRSDLERVEALLRENTESDQTFVQEASAHLMAAGGKRFRPMLTLLAGFLGDPKDPRLVPCAAAIELTHLATLYHDDVIDETALRRGVETANTRYGNTVAVLTGDFLFARSSSLAADLGSYVSRRLADTVAELCEGQIMETRAVGDLSVAESYYLDVIKRKTGALIATSCHLGSWLAGAPEANVEAATRYGDALGMAFQLSDDLLDVVGDEGDFGKRPGTDLREGVMTLPALATLNGAVDGGAPFRAAMERADIDGALEVLRTNGSIDRTRAAVDEWIGTARAALAELPDGPARDAFDRLAEFLAERTA